MLYFHQQNRHDAISVHHVIQENEIPSTYSDAIPSITGSVSQDASGTWLLEIQTTHFTFTPKKIGSQEESFHEGHAHLYINGKKINRIYGEYYNLDTLTPGTYDIKVTLNGNNHGVLTYDGKEIAYSETFIVKRGKVNDN